jgi:hypothetical protein
VAWVRSLTGGKNFLSEHTQKNKNKGAGKPSTYFEGSGKNVSQCGVNRIPKKKKKKELNNRKE